MYIVVRINEEKDTVDVLYESDEYIDCEIYVNSLTDKTNITIEERY